MVRFLIIFVVLFQFSKTARSQFAYMGGTSLNYVRNNHLLENQKPIMAFDVGFSFKVYPFKKIPAFALQSELLYDQKGYMQKLEKDYFFRFNYFSWTILACYPIIKDLSVNGGIDLSRMVSTNVLDGMTTYNHGDNGLVLGLSCCENHRISFYARAVYGLTPMLDYYKIDKLGNFTGKIKDLKNTSISIGIKININDEKILLFK